MSSDTVCCLAFSNNKKFDTNQRILICIGTTVTTTGTNYQWTREIVLKRKEGGHV